MAKTWDSFETRVREIAQYIWQRQCVPKRVGGVKVDGVIELDSETVVLIEITEERTLGKVRGDVVKLQAAKAAAYTEGFLARCYCVVNGSITDGMRDSGKDNRVTVLSVEEFSKIFFDFEAYRFTREEAPFGSAVDPLTGEQDKTEYVSVKYRVDGRATEVSAKEIGQWLADGKKVILLGEYGSGKSRCVREVFRYLSSQSSTQFCYPMAIDLRNSWGLVRYSEMIRRHFADLGLDELQAKAVRAFNVGSVAVLLDGFDEIGSQSWSNDDQRLRNIRAKSLEGVKDIVGRSKGGVLITGREHYFPTNSEMLAAFGLRESDVILLKSKDEFSEDELQEYFNIRDIDVEVPSWLPRRPLICQTISALADDDFEEMFGDDNGEVAFWDRFIKVLCERDSRIHISFDPNSIYRLFINLARLTRTKAANVGPISLAELQAAFEAAVGRSPVEEASVMLQRLPSLGRLDTESNDRQFIDVYILDGLRAKDVAEVCVGDEKTIQSVSESHWSNGLDRLGQRILRQDNRVGTNGLLQLARRCVASGNGILASDIIGALASGEGEAVDFEGLRVDQGNFIRLDLTGRVLRNITISNCVIDTLNLPAKGAENGQIVGCMSSRVIGVTSRASLPPWIRNFEADVYDSVENVSRIRRIGLASSQEILITIIRKTFFQKGSGRKEEALIRGLGKVGRSNITSKVINLLLREGIIQRFKGDGGFVYTPNRSEAGRMKTMLNDLVGSQDPIWLEVANL